MENHTFYRTHMLFFAEHAAAPIGRFTSRKVVFQTTTL